MKLQVLVATIKQEDFSLIEKMNIRCDAVIANQAGRNEFSEVNTEFGKVRMITTDTQGVGLNRNIALMASDADILLLADDDMIYNDDMPEKVVEAFEKNPDADVIIFSIDIVKNGEITERRNDDAVRLHLWNSMRFGTYTIAVKRRSVINNNITFSQCFGGGCEFSAGEDSLFLRSCFKNGLKVYSDSYVLGSCCKDISTWFTGYNKKYFYDKGVLLSKLFPGSAYIMALYFGVFFKRETEIDLFKRLRLIYRGIRAGKKMIPYSENK